MPRVKGIIKKMHGLNKSQIVQWIPQQFRELTNTSQAAAGYEYGLDDPDTLVDLGVTLSGAQVEFYPFKAHMDLKFFNYGSAPCYAQTIKVRIRNDIDQPSFLLGIMGTDAPAVVNPFLSITTSNMFQKNCKILYNKTMLLKPSHCLSIKCSRKYRASKAWTGRYEANASYAYIKYNTVIVTRFWGMPVYNGDFAAGNQGQQLASFRIGGVRKMYFSWYNMSDDTPTSTAPIGLPLSHQATLQTKFYTSDGLQQFDVPTPQLPPIAGTLPAGPSHAVGLREFPVDDRT